jgi:23S rRNA U2552 (ribose-2'-O)-methylase RlmE/FtsJ
MEITIFKRNEITFELFTNQSLWVYEICESVLSLKDPVYGNFKELDETKTRLDLLDRSGERFRKAAAKYLHEYELVKILCKKKVLSRAYFKLYEMIYFEPIVLKETCDCFFICEAPGGFIECVTDVRRKKNKSTNYISISKYDLNIKYGNYFEPKNLLYGDISKIPVINQTIETTLQRFPRGLDLITADGGFDVKVFIAQEILCSKLLLCEIYLAVKTQKIGGMFIIKFFDMFSHNTVIYYLILCSYYNHVKIIKPKSSRNCNSERYLVCYEFKGQNQLSDNIYKIIQNFQCTNETENFIYTTIFPHFDFSKICLEKLKVFNNIIVDEQIKTINDSIKMVTGKNLYFQNLILSIFIDTKCPHINKIHMVNSFRHILASRIKKCIDFLKMYNLHINYTFSENGQQSRFLTAYIKPQDPQYSQEPPYLTSRKNEKDVHQKPCVLTNV